MAEANWYVVHTYSGYENKVKTNIEQSIENRKLQGSDIRSISSNTGSGRIEKWSKESFRKETFPWIRAYKHGYE